MFETKIGKPESDSKERAFFRDHYVFETNIKTPEPDSK